MPALGGAAAAEESVTNVRLHWQRFASEHRAAIDRLHLPGVTGGGLAKAEEKGHGSSISLLRHLFALWFLIFLLNVGLGFVWHWPAIKSWPFIGDWVGALTRSIHIPQ